MFVLEIAHQRVGFKSFAMAMIKACQFTWHRNVVSSVSDDQGLIVRFYPKLNV